MGRAGRLLPNGERLRSMVSILYNSQDLAVKGMSEEIKVFCRSQDHCLRERLKEFFIGDYSEGSSSTVADNFCCTVCDKTKQSSGH